MGSIGEQCYTREETAHLARRWNIEAGSSVSLVAYDATRDLYVFDILDVPTAQYAPAEIRDRWFDVTETRSGYRVGEDGVTAIRFYTGFAGCPTRYYVTRNGITFDHREEASR